jgi:manganese/zinc/iron transport system permease protein
MEQLEIQVIAAITATACALPGVFLVLRRMAMMSDAISHALLPGIVAAFFLVGDLRSPLLIAGAAVTGVLTVALVELIHRTRLVREDAAIGIVFPVLFSLGVVLITRYAGDVHLDTDAVLLGELAFAPFDRMLVGGYDLGPRAVYVMGSILLVNAGFIGLFYKELKLATFDAALAAALGFAPGLLHYALMTLVSITAVGAFDAVGSILVVALMIGPPAAAYLLTERLSRMIAWSVALGIASALGGYWLAWLLDASIAGAMATMVGVLFAFVLLFSPRHGWLAAWQRRRYQRWHFAEKMLTIHLLHHEGAPEAPEECRVDHLQAHLRWPPAFAEQVVRKAVQDGLVAEHIPHLALTPAGRTLARESLMYG